MASETTLRSRILALLVETFESYDERGWREKFAALLEDITRQENKLVMEGKGNEFEFPDLSTWPSNEPPFRKKLWSGKEDGFEIVNPLFAWFAMCKSCKHPDSVIEKFFRLLMKCHCDTGAVLGAHTSNGKVLLQYAAEKQASPIVLRLLLAEKHLPLYGDPIHSRRGPTADFQVPVFEGYCCALCVLIRESHDDHALAIAKGMSHEEIMMTCAVPHANLHTSSYFAPNTFVFLWDYIKSRISEINRLKELFRFSIHFDGTKYFSFILSGVAQLSSQAAWERVTRHGCVMAEMALMKENRGTERAYVGPLEMVMRRAAISLSEKDLRCAWLVARESADCLNKIDRTGRGPLLRAMQEGLFLTVETFFSRIKEIDILAVTQVYEFKSFAVLPSDALLQKELRISEHSFLSPFVRMKPHQSTFQHFVKVYRESIPAIQATVVTILKEINIPKPLVELCLQYASFM